MTVTLPGGSDTIVGCAEPGAATRFGEISFDGRLAVIRREAGGAITSVLMVEGSKLTEGDTVLAKLVERGPDHIELTPFTGG